MILIVEKEVVIIKHSNVEEMYLLIYHLLIKLLFLKLIMLQG